MGKLENYKNTFFLLSIYTLFYPFFIEKKTLLDNSNFDFKFSLFLYG